MPITHKMQIHYNSASPFATVSQKTWDIIHYNADHQTKWAVSLNPGNLLQLWAFQPLLMDASLKICQDCVVDIIPDSYVSTAALLLFLMAVPLPVPTYPWLSDIIITGRVPSSNVEH